MKTNEPSANGRLSASTRLEQPLADLKIGSKLLLRRKGLEKPTVGAVARTAPSTMPFAEVTRSQAGIEGMPLSPLTKRGLTVEVGSSHHGLPVTLFEPDQGPGESLNDYPGVS